MSMACNGVLAPFLCVCGSQHILHIAKVLRMLYVCGIEGSMEMGNLLLVRRTENLFKNLSLNFLHIHYLVTGNNVYSRF